MSHRQVPDGVPAKIQRAPSELKGVFCYRDYAGSEASAAFSLGLVLYRRRSAPQVGLTKMWPFLRP